MIEEDIVEGLPTVEQSQNGWSPKLVCDWLRQTRHASFLRQYSDRRLYSVIYLMLRRLRKQNKIDAAYGEGDNGRETLTYNRHSK